MSEVIQLFPELPRDVNEGDLVWLPRFAAFGTIMSIKRSGLAAIAMRGRTVALHLIRDRHEIHTGIESADRAIDRSPA